MKYLYLCFMIRCGISVKDWSKAGLETGISISPDER